MADQTMPIRRAPAQAHAQVQAHARARASAQLADSYAFIGRASTRRHTRRPAGDRGSSSVEFTILFPIIVVLLFGGPQLAMWYFARQAAQSAAGAAARAASVVSASPRDGAAAADSFLAKVGTGTITSYTVDEHDTATTVTIHIHASVPNVVPLPGFAPSVDVTVIRARERFTTPDSP